MTKTKADAFALLTDSERETIKAALTFALDMGDCYFTFAPHRDSDGVDYNGGNQRKDAQRTRIAKQLLGVL